MKEAHTLYDRENRPYNEDRVIAAYAAWLKSVEWQLFATFTFGSRRSDESASRAFDRFINRLEREIGADIVYVRGDEKRISGCGKPDCGRHFHVALASAAPLPPNLVKWHWKYVGGDYDDGADVQPYDADRNGIRYILKMMNQQHGDWKARSLDLVFPVSAEKLNKRKRRHLRRHEARIKAFADKKVLEMKSHPKLDPSLHSLYEQML
jgi:hypothetical protein